MPSPIRNLDDARREFDALAVITRRINAADAQGEARIAAIKTDCATATAPDRTAAKAIRDRLTTYIRKHLDQFADPRSVATPFGAFGVRDAVSLAIDPDREDDLLAWLAANGCDDCIKPPAKPFIIKDAVRNRLERGQPVPYCTTTTTTRAFIEITDALAGRD